MVRAAVVLACFAMVACTAEPGPPPGEIEGTWGGVDAGLIADDSLAHVHIGCTEGNAELPIAVNEDGTFEASGTYSVTVHPVLVGPFHPARFTGRIVGSTMTLTVTLLDTNATRGPVQLTFGATPQMGPCPICRPSRAVSAWLPVGSRPAPAP